MAKNSPSETRTSRMAYCSKSLLPSSANCTNPFQSISCPFHRRTQWNDPPNQTVQLQQTANGGVEFRRLQIMCPSVPPIERATREPRMDPQSTAFPAQPC